MIQTKSNIAIVFGGTVGSISHLNFLNYFRARGWGFKGQNDAILFAADDYNIVEAVLDCEKYRSMDNGINITLFQLKEKGAAEFITNTEDNSVG